MRKTTKRLLMAGGVLAGAAVAALCAAWLGIGWTDEGSDDYAGGVVLRDAGGEVLRVSLGENDVDCRPYYVADPDDWIVKALVASEDGTFWEHCGVRPLSILRATLQNLFYRRRISGASTITMQAVRLIRPHRKTLWWKFKEAVMALKMERAKDKRWILSQYLNRAPYGSNFIGIEAAANGWFGKGAKQLGLGEAAMLAGMVQAPSRFRPDRGFERAIRRRDYVLGRMKALGMITDDQMRGAQSVRPVVCRAPRPFRHPYFCDWALRHLGRDRAAQRHGGDYVTTLDADVQEICDNAVAEAAEKGGYSVAAVVMRVDTGAVTALACSGDYLGGEAGQVNTALAPRPAGSTLKPFLVAIALDRGFVTPEERLADVPTAFKGYRPANFDAKHRGMVTARDALVLSLNIPFVRLLKDVGIELFGSTLRDLGLSNMHEPDGAFGLGMAIGNVRRLLSRERHALWRRAQRGGAGACGGRGGLAVRVEDRHERRVPGRVDGGVEPRLRGGRVVRTRVGRLRGHDARGREGGRAARVAHRASTLSAQRRAVVRGAGRGDPQARLLGDGPSGERGLSGDGGGEGARGAERYGALRGTLS